MAAIEAVMAAALRRSAGVRIIEIETPRAGTDLHGHARFGGSLQNHFHIEISAFTVGDFTSGGVTDNIHMRVVHCFQQTLRDLFARLA